MARLIYILAFVTVCFAARAQQAKTVYPAETVVINPNATALLAGETLYYSVFCLNPEKKSLSDLSKIAYVELVDSKREVVQRQKIRLENGIGNGDIFIPTAIESGNYKLVGYTKYMIDGSERNFFALDLTIVNTFRSFDGVLNPAQTEKTANVNSSGSLAMPDKQVYGRREKVVVKLGLENLAGHYTVSVKKADGFGPVKPGKVMPPAKTQNAVPELRGALLTGRIISEKPSKNLANKNIALSVPGHSFGFKIVQTDRSGRFIFVLDQMPDHPEAVIQVMEPDRDQYKITVDQNKRPDYSNLTFEPLQISESDKTAIADRAVAVQIENAYFHLKKDSIAAGFAPEPFFHPLEKVYALDDYTRFPSVKETIIEVIKEMYFTKKSDRYEIHLRNMTMNNEQFGSALVLVDGLLLQDYQALFAYGAKQIEKVSLINEPYVYGPKTFSGVANFTTKLGDFKYAVSGDYFKKITLELPQPEKHYFAPDYSSGQSRIPDYRHQLLWLPNVSVEMREFTFFTSDITGAFEIVVSGFSGDGTPVFYTRTFEVK